MKKKAQEWVSTLIYVLIGISIISSLLLAATPKIEQARDKFTINYMITALNSLDLTIREVNEVVGTRRSFEIKINKGNLKILPEKDIIEWRLNTNFEFSEPNKTIKIDAVNVLTEKKQGRIEVSVFLNYSSSLINITTATDKEGNNLTFTPSATPYTIWIENMGQVDTKNTIYVSSSL